MTKMVKIFEIKCKCGEKIPVTLEINTEPNKKNPEEVDVTINVITKK